MSGVFGTSTSGLNPSAGFSFGTPTTSASTTAPFGTFASTSIGTPNIFGTGTGSTGTSTLFPSFSSTSSLTPASTTTSTTSLFPSLGQTTTTSAPSSIGFGLNTGVGFTNPTSSVSLFGTGTTLGVPTATTATTTTTSVGLGGVDITQLSGGLNGGNATGKKDSKTIKESQLPNEISVTLESFKKYVKEQKSVREEMARVSCKNIVRVQEQTTALKQLLSVISNGLQRNALAIDKLKQESAQELRNAEIGQRTKETPPTLQYEHTAPSEYFHNLSVNFEHQMQQYRRQIEQLERHLLSLSQPSVLTPNELTVIMHRLHDTFVALAAQLQTVHQSVQVQKEQFMNYQRLIHGELSTVFLPRKDGIKDLISSGKVPVTVGPAPFSNMPSPAAVAMASALSRTEQPGNTSSVGSGVGSSGLGTSLTSGSFLGNPSSNLGNTFMQPSFGLQSSSVFKPLGQANVPSFNTSSLGGVPGGLASDGTPQMPFTFNNQKTFQLQKPPVGNKRGKRWTST